MDERLAYLEKNGHNSPANTRNFQLGYLDEPIEEMPQDKKINLYIDVSP